MATVTSTAAVDPHLDWEREATALWAALRVEEGRDDIFQRAIEVHKRIASTPARTPAGVAVQVRLAIWSAKGSALNGTDFLALDNADAALERMAPNRP